MRQNDEASHQFQNIHTLTHHMLNKIIFFHHEAEPKFWFGWKIFDYVWKNTALKTIKQIIFNENKIVNSNLTYSDYEKIFLFAFYFCFDVVVASKLTKKKFIRFNVVNIIYQKERKNAVVAAAGVGSNTCLLLFVMPSVGGTHSIQIHKKTDKEKEEAKETKNDVYKLLCLVSNLF